MALRSIRVLSLTLLLTCVIAGANNGSAPLLRLIPEGGTDHLYPVVSQSGGRLKWIQGAFIFNEQTSPYFYTLNSEGDVIRKVFLDEPDDARYFITDFDRKNDGTIVVAAIPDDENASPFLAWIAPDGTTQRIVRTAPYYPNLLTIAQDGTVWTLGYEAIHKRTDDPALDPNDGVLRQFDRGGKMIASALPQRDFTGLRRSEMLRITHGRLCAIHEHLVWYSSVRGNSRYVEIPMDKIELHVFPGVPKELSKSDSLDGGIEALTVMDTGNAAVSVSEQEKHATFLLDRTTGRWIRVAVPPIRGFTGSSHMVGADADRLVFSSGTSAAFFALAGQDITQSP